MHYELAVTTRHDPASQRVAVASDAMGLGEQIPDSRLGLQHDQDQQDSDQRNVTLLRAVTLRVQPRQGHDCGESVTSPGLVLGPRAVRCRASLASDAKNQPRSHPQLAGRALGAAGVGSGLLGRLQALLAAAVQLDAERARICPAWTPPVAFGQLNQGQLQGVK
jgi:hypothetical protein